MRSFNKALAEEEGCSVSLIKQLLVEKKPAKNWFDASPIPKGTVQKKSKTQR